MKNFFHSKVVGVTFTDAQNIIPKLKPDMWLKLVRQPDNPYDFAFIIRVVKREIHVFFPV